MMPVVEPEDYEMKKRIDVNAAEILQIVEVVTQHNRNLR
jgi:hypothetical protein